MSAVQSEEPVVSAAFSNLTAVARARSAEPEGPARVRPQVPLRTAVVLGTGLVGTSVALALTAAGVRVHLEDTDQAAAVLAQSRGAGTAGPPATPADLAVVAVPPAAVGRVVREAQRRGTARHFVDVASVKAVPVADVAARGCDTSRFIGGHPMAGGERSGPGAARADLFHGRPWVLTPLPETRGDTLNAALDLVTVCGATPVMMQPADHDRAVALVSHAPHVVSSLLAARLEHAPSGALRLSGRGVGDMTRIAGADPALWADILGSNADAVADVLDGLAEDLGRTVAALRALASADTSARAGARQLTDVLRRGRAGRARIDEVPTGTTRTG